MGARQEALGLHFKNQDSTKLFPGGEKTTQLLKQKSNGGPLNSSGHWFLGDLGSSPGSVPGLLAGLGPQFPQL